MFEEMKGLTPKKKVEHYIHYYGLVTVIIIAVIAFVIYWIIHITTAKTSVAGILAINSLDTNDTTGVEEYLDGLLEAEDYSTGKYEIELDTGIYAGDNVDSQSAYYGTLKIQAVLAGQTCDVVLVDESYVQTLVDMGPLEDLHVYLTDEQLADHEEDLIYYTDEETNETYPVAIKTNPDTTLFTASDWYSGMEVYIGICVNTLDEGDRFCKQILLDALGE